MVGQLISFCGSISFHLHRVRSAVQSLLGQTPPLSAIFVVSVTTDGPRGAGITFVIQGSMKLILVSFRIILIFSWFISHFLVQIKAADMQEKAKTRLCELAPAARGSEEAGFTQPSLNLFLHLCILIRVELRRSLMQRFLFQSLDL